MSFWAKLCRSPNIRRRTPAFAFLALLLLAPLYAGKIPCKFTTESRVVAVADIHGDYDNFVKILKGTQLIDENLNWKGEKTHLVQTGDILDRGEGSGAKEALDLLMKLEKQAEAAGGMVHMLIGNHEVANITGLVFDQARYLTYGQLRSFLPQTVFNKYDNRFRKELGLVDGSDGHVAEIEDLWIKELNKAQGKQPGDNELRDEYTKNFYKDYGKWLLTKNIVIKINENIFVHGGLADNEAYLIKDLETINDEARREFRSVAEWAMDLPGTSLSRPFLYLMAPQAPHWHRDWARVPEDRNSSALERVLANYKAKRMIIGHTVRDVEYIETQELHRFDGRVWAIDVGISKFYNGVLCALIIERKRVQIITKEYEVSTFHVWWGDDEKE